MPTLHEVKTRFAKAVLQMIAEERDDDPDWTVGMVIEKTGLNEGQVRRAIEEFGLPEWNFDNFGYRGDSRARMEAFISIEPDPSSHPLSEDRTMTTHEQMKHAVATALADMGRDPDLRGQLLTAAEVARRSNVHIGHVREIMRAEFGLKFDAGPQESFGWSRQKYEAIEAYALIPISRGAPMVKSQVFNIGTNHGQVVAGDNHGDFMLSVSHHLEQVVRAWNGPEKVDGVLV